MNENRRQILEMLAAGKITANEAERLLAALEPDSGPNMGEFPGSAAGGGGSKTATVKTRVKYLRVLVEADESMTGLKGSTTRQRARALAIAASGRAAGQLDSRTGARAT